MYKEEKINKIIAFLAVIGLVVSALVFLILSSRATSEINTVMFKEGASLENAVGIDNIQAQNILNQKRAWYKVIEELIQVSNKVVDKPHASYKFNACFLKDYECVAHSQAYRDEFKKLTFYYAPSNYTQPYHHVTFYLSLEDGALPYTIMRFSYVGEDWLYIKRIAVLVDNEVVFEQALQKTQIRREVVSGGIVYEIGDVLMKARMDVIKKIASADTLAVRISGMSGDAHLDEPTLKNVQMQAGEILLMYGLMQAAINGSTLDREAVSDNDVASIEQGPTENLAKDSV